MSGTIEEIVDLVAESTPTINIAHENSLTLPSLQGSIEAALLERGITLIKVDQKTFKANQSKLVFLNRQAYSDDDNSRKPGIMWGRTGPLLHFW